MTTAELVIAGLLKKSETDIRRRYILATQKLSGEVFEGTLQTIYRTLEHYYNLTQEFVDNDIFRMALEQSGWTLEKKTECLSEYKRLESVDVKADKFTYAVDNLLKQKSILLYTSSLTKSMQSLASAQQSDEVTIHESYLQARSKLEQDLENIDRLCSRSLYEKQASEMVLEKKDRIAAAVPDAPTAHVKYGFAVLDRTMKYIKKGNLVIVGAYVGQGKSQTLVNLFYNMTVLQKKNGAYISFEDSNEACFSRFSSRHSLHAKFGGEGILHENIAEEKLNNREKRLYDIVLDDIKNEEGKAYGFMRFMQMPRGSGPTEVWNALSKVNSLYPLDVVFLDYLTLMSPKSKRTSKREEVSDLVQAVKDGALSFANGKGVACVAATQIGRQEFLKASKSGEYTLSSFAESSAIEQSADAAIWLLRRPEEERAREVKIGIVKRREGGLPTIRSFFLYEDFAHSYLGDLKSEDGV